MAKTVLIVEDERAIVEILKFNLKREGYETLEALDGEKMRVLEHLGCDPVPYVEACKFRNSLDEQSDAKAVLSMSNSWPRNPTCTTSCFFFSMLSSKKEKAGR